MNLAYIDCGLLDNMGHRANACRHITNEFKSRGYTVDVYGPHAVSNDLVRDLHVIPLVRHDPYRMPAPGILGKILLVRSFFSDLLSISKRKRYELFYFNSIKPVEFLTLSLWIQTLDESERELVVVEFGLSANNNLTLPKKLKLLNEHKPMPFLFTFDERASAEHARVLGLPVHTLPLVHAGIGQPRRRNSDSGITVSFLGHQRTEKGSALLPSIIERLLASASNITILAHDGGEESEVANQLRRLADQNPRVSLVHKAADQQLWQQLLDKSDLIVLPYDPEYYRAMYSAVASEAVSEAIPMVVPAGSTMDALAASYNSGAVRYNTWDAEHISKATTEAVEQFAPIAEKAYTASLEFRWKNGAKQFADNIERLVREPANKR